ALGASPSPTSTAKTDSAGATSGTGSARQEGSGEPHAVLIGVAGLSWADIDRENTPTLFEMAGTSSVASMTVRTVRSETCPVDGWLTLGAGSRATDAVDGDGTCREVPEPIVRPSENGDATLTIPDWNLLTDAQTDFGYSSTPGLLGQRVQESGQCATAVGPGAGLTLANSAGTVPSYVESHRDLTTELLEACPLTVVDMGSVPTPAPDGSEPAIVEAAEERRDEAVRALDQRIAEIIELLPSNSGLFIAGIADSAPTGLPTEEDPDPVAPSGLRLAMAAGAKPDGAEFGPTWLSSASTRWAGLVQLIDLTSTLLQYAGVDDSAAGTVGRPWLEDSAHPSTAAETVDQLLGTDRATQVFRTQSGPFFQLLGITQVLFFGVVWLLLHRRSRRRTNLLRVTRAAALLAAAFPIASFLSNLAQWWRFERADLVLWPTMFGITVVIAVLALSGPWRRRVYGAPGVVAALTVTVMSVDLLTGSNLQHTSLLGLSPLVAGRFYGLGNIPYAIFVAALLVSLAALAQWMLDSGRTRRATATAVSALGAVAVVIIGAPWAGADVGGILATIPALIVLVLSVSGVRVTLIRVAAAGVAALVLFLLVAWLDWLRPVSQQTHFGQFFDDLLSGDGITVVLRKAGAALGTLQRSAYYGWLVPVAYALIIWLTKVRPHRGFTALAERWPGVPHLIAALLLAGALGFATNDSGIIVPALLLTAAIPLVISALAHVAVELPAPAPKKKKKPTDDESAQPHA
ncbi:MAG TPA: hypothetical protein VK053_20045, partial [Jiangellaceae bacterium]|nr:hypothetical protein [Jiangellaceae bacterium]